MPSGEPQPTLDLHSLGALIQNKIAEPHVPAEQQGRTDMRNWGALLAIIAVALANLPALIDYWRSDRPGFITTSWMLAIYLLYCLLGGGLIIWLISRAAPTDDPWKPLQATGIVVGFILYRRPHPPARLACRIPLGLMFSYCSCLGRAPSLESHSRVLLGTGI